MSFLPSSMPTGFDQTSVQSLIKQISTRQYAVECSGLAGADRAYFISKLYQTLQKLIVVIFPSAKQAQRFSEDLDYFLNHSDSVWHYPSLEIGSMKFFSSQNETAVKRIQTLYGLVAERSACVMIASAEAMMQYTLPKSELLDYAELVMSGESLDRDRLIEKLVSGGYSRSVIVEEPGDFCVRGGIVDVFSPLYPNPLRIELLGDRVESLRMFSAATQRKINMMDEAILLPVREMILKPSVLNEFVSQLRIAASEQDIPAAKLKELTDRIHLNGSFAGMETLMPLIYPEPASIFDYTPDDAVFILMEPADLEAAANRYQEKQLSDYRMARNEGRLCLNLERRCLKWEAVKERLSQKKPVSIKLLPTSEQRPDTISCHFTVKDNSDIRTELRIHRNKESLLLPLVNWIKNYQQTGLLTLLVCSTQSQAERIDSLLRPYGIQAGLIKGFPQNPQSNEGVYISLGQISSGFVWESPLAHPFTKGEDGGIAIITEDEIFGVKHHRKRIPSSNIRTDLLNFGELKQGDLVVHSEHGIGQYEGLIKIEIEKIRNDYLMILFKDEDRLYVPVDRMDMVRKYVGVEGAAPVLDKMGGKSWEQTKAKVKKSVERIAGSLLKLYAERKVVEGHAFSPPDSYFRDFEAGFAYEETPDQLKAIEEVLEDMTRPVPMDRLVCGDVGYGKTEVALRAAFLAVNDGKQAAVLVPTTVLAEQHYATFTARFERHPVRIACLTRFRSPKEQRDIIAKLKTGEIDIVIGTHRLIQKDVVFKALGLLVIDEEHRFGVKDKEKLKKLRSNVDVLALTATPIPRTLHLSLTGVRDITLINTPPEDRQPIVTYICEYDDQIIAQAIRFELERNGQIFFVHNNIYTIEAITAHLQTIVPEVRIDVAHGRMDADVLEKVMMRFINREIDMLVCTTIIESGLDIPNANTIFVNRADKFGMAQLYQLRGRVGRAGEQAYAYLFVPPETVLNRDAQKRLKVLMEHSDLGAGFQIAMNDLQIRGGGTILGSAQSGHIAAVGYDMFLELMEQAVSDLKGEPVEHPLNPEINLPVSAFLSETYIPDIDQRLSAYRRLARMTELKEIADFKNELTDRFGPLPNDAAHLLLKMMLKVLAVKTGVRRVDISGHQLALYFSPDHLKRPEKLVQMAASKKGQFELSPNGLLKVKLLKGNESSLIVQAKNVMKEIEQQMGAS